MEIKRVTLSLFAAAFGVCALTLAQEEAQQDPPAPAAEAGAEGEKSETAQAAPAEEEQEDVLSAAEKLQQEQEREARRLVQELADDSYRVREAATRELWDLGVVGMEAIKEGVESTDPEVAYRSRILLRRILTGITPDTPQKVVDLVQKYFRSGVNGKKSVFEDLLEEAAYMQMLRIYRFEEDEIARRACEELADKAALPAVLQALVEDRLKDGESILRLAPVNDQNCRRLAALLRVQGTVQEEADRLAGEVAFDDDGKVTAASMPAAMMRLAALRAKGDTVKARELAESMGREDLAASLALFEGDPVPYLRWFMERQNESPVVRVHAETVLKRWQGDEEGAARLMQNVAKVAVGGGEEEREAMLSLLLNGYLDLGIPLVEQSDKDSAFGYYETVELPRKAVEIYGYTGSPEEKKQWLEERYEMLKENWLQNEEERYEVLTIASFLHTRGEKEEARAIMLTLSEIAGERGRSNWLEFIGRLNDLGGSLYELAFIMATEKLTPESAPREDLSIVSHLFGEGDAAPRLWKLLEPIEEDKSARILLLGALYGYVHLDQGTLGEAFQALDEMLGEEGKASVQTLSDLLEAAEERDDAARAMALLERIIKVDDGDVWQKKMAAYYGYVSEWEKAIDAYGAILEEEPTNMRYLALYGGALIRAGKGAEAEAPLKKVELYALAEPIRLLRLAIDVERSGVTDKAAGYWKQLLVTNPATDWYWQSATSYFVKHARKKKQWRVAAAFAEVDAMQYLSGRSTFPNPVSFIRKRFAADLYRGLALLEEGDREGAMKLLRRAFEILNGDGILADDYFPLLREAGVIEEHDRNFNIVYERLEESIKAYPKAHNTYNSAAWMASRASRNLDDAHEKIRTALEMRPMQAAYLDTMAEVWFAKGNREKAVEWSRKAVRDSFHGGSSSDAGVGLREQFDRFQFGDFPVP